MKPSFILVFCFTIIFITGSSFLNADEGKDVLLLPAGTMVLKAPPDFETRFNPVPFSHSQHFSNPCKSCHHNWDGQSAVQGCATSGCHDQFWPEPPGERSNQEKQLISMTGAYHKACRGCHYQQSKEISAADQKACAVTTGPVSCDGCHSETDTTRTDDLETLEIPVGPVTIEAPGDVWQSRASVSFPHSDHFNYACMTCHHEWDGYSPIESCAACHDETSPHESTRDIKDPRNAYYFLAAYHNGCINCHRTLLKQRQTIEKNAPGKKNLPAYGPVRCNGCHNM
ncbi:MAG: cytochrome c3 family protein [Desulfobacteraceae bacterium]